MLKNLNVVNYYKFVKKLDPNNTDLVSLKQICTFFALLSDSVPSPSDLSILTKKAQNSAGESYPKLSQEQFTALEFWFDEAEKSETLPNHEDFHRDVKLKEILFDVNKTVTEEGEFLDFEDFIKILDLRAVELDYEKLQGESYYEVMFFWWYKEDTLR